MIKVTINFVFLFLIFQSGLAQFSGGSGTRKDPFQISTLEDLRMLSEDTQYLSNHFILQNDIDASDTRNWNIVNNDTLGFTPIAYSSTDPGQSHFEGSFEGRGYTISNLYINRPQDIQVGFFSSTQGAVINHLGLWNSTIIGGNVVGTLVGLSQSSKISNCYATGTVKAFNEVGGLIGASVDGHIVGCYANTAVTGISRVGGLVGSLFNGQLSDCFASGRVTGQLEVGGFVAAAGESSIARTYSMSEVATQDLASSGAFVGFTAGALNRISSSYFDQDLSVITQAEGEGGQGSTSILALKSADFSDPSLFEASGWDFSDVWEIQTFPPLGSQSRPFLKSQFYDIQVDINDFPAGAATRFSGASFYGTGDPVTVEAETGTDFDFIGWYLEDSLVSTENPFSFTCTEPITYTATFKEKLAFPFSGGLGTVADPYQIETIEQLQSINAQATLMGRYYVLIDDIDAKISATWNSGKGFTPIGYPQTDGSYLPFTGSIDGQGHRIEYLTINRPEEDQVALIRSGVNAEIKRLGLYEANISGYERVGGLFGQLTGERFRESIRFTYVSGDISGYDYVGGLAGTIENMEVEDSYSTARLIGNAKVGGLVGAGYATNLSSCYNAGAVIGNELTGGIMGSADQDTRIDQCAFDRERSVVKEGVSQNFPNLDYLSIRTSSFKDPFVTELQLGMYGDHWKYAYGHDGYQRPVLLWETTYALTAPEVPGGQLGDVPREVVSSRSSGTLTALPNAAFIFKQWQDDSGNILGKNNPLVIAEISRPTRVVPVFEERLGSYRWILNVKNQSNTQIVGANVNFDGEIYQTDSLGQVRLEQLAADAYPFVVSAPGYVQALDTLPISNQDVQDTITLLRKPSPINTLTFNVKNGTNPIPNAVINVKMLVSGQTVSTTTDQNGRATLDNIALDFTVSVSAEGFAPVSEDYTLVDIKDVTYNFQLLSLNDAIFHIEDENTIPVSGAQFFIQGGDQFISNDQGKVFIPSLPTGSYSYWLNQTGFETLTGTFSIENEVFNDTVVLKPPVVPVYKLNIKLRSGPFHLNDANILLNSGQFNTDDQGELSIFVPSGDYTYQVFTEGFSTNNRDTLTVADADLTSIIDLEPLKSAPLTFKVTEPDGDPVLGAIVNFGGYLGITNSSGELLIPDIPRDRHYDIEVSAPDYATVRSNLFLETTEAGGLFLRRLYDLTLTVKNEAGQLLPEAYAVLRNTTFNADANGSIFIADVPSYSDYLLEVGAPGYNTIEEPIRLDSLDVSKAFNLSTSPAYQVIFNVFDDSNPLPGAEILFNGTTYLTNSSGEVTIQPVVPGDYEYVAMLSGYNSQAGILRVTDSDVTKKITLEVQSIPVYTVRFNVSDASGTLAAAQVVFDGTRYTTNNKGEVIITNVATGDYPFTVSLLNYNAISGTITVTNEDVLKAIVLEKEKEMNTYTITFTIGDSDGALEGATLTINNATYSSDDQGRIFVSNVANGVYTYTIIMPSYKTYQGTLNVNGTDESVSILLEQVILSVDLEVNGLLVYPNPADERIFYQWKEVDSMFVEVIDQLGKVVVQKKIQGNEGSIDMANLKTGLYLLTLTSGSDQRVTKKIHKR